MVAALDRRADRDHGAGRRRHASYRIRTFDRRVETDHRHAAATHSGAMDTGVRCLQDHTAISRTQRRHESWGVPDDFLVGMEPPAAGARDRSRVPVAVSLVLVARRSGRGPKAAVVADLWPRRTAGGGRLVDGGIRAFAAGRGFAISPRYSSGAGASHLCGNRLDGAAAGGPAAGSRILAAENHQRGAPGADIRAA